MKLLAFPTLLPAFLVGVALTFATGAQLRAAENLVQNPDFSEVDEGGLPTAWKLDNLQPTTVDTTEKPEGAAASLRVDISEDKGKNMGQIIQEVPVGPGEVYRVSALVRASTSKAGVLQIKLRKGKTEGERISLEAKEDAWTEVSKTFATGESDNVLVICRYSQKSDHVGATVAFSQVQLTRLEGAEAEAELKAAEEAAAAAKAKAEADNAKAEAANAKLGVAALPSGAEAVAVPTFECLGLYWKPDGASAKNACTVTYRAAGDPEWNEALPLWFDPNDHKGLPMRSQEYRGSIVGLKPGTEYEVKLALAEGGATTTLKTRTWSEEFKIAKTITLTAANFAQQPYVISEGGSPESGYVQYVTEPGLVIDGQDTAECHISVEASWVMIKGITAKGAAKHGIWLKDVTDVVIDGCDISGWGRVEHDKEGFGVNMDSALYSKSTALERIIIQNNKLHHPRSNANSWEQEHSRTNDKPTKHPLGPQCISFFGPRGQLVIRNNEFYSDPEHKFNDVMGEHKNFSFHGFPVRDSDVYNNRVANAYDDGIELEGANMNVRAWNNQFHDVYGAVGCAATSLGPVYIFRNVLHSSRKGPLTMNTFQGNRGSYLVKLGSEASGAQYSKGQINIFHNTMLQPPAPAGMSDFKTIGGMAGIVLTSDKKRQINIVSRNNIIYLREREEGKWNAINDPQLTAANDFDYDLYNGSVKAVEGAQKNGIEGIPTFQDPSAPALAEGSLGIDAGARLPNFNDGYQGNAPDMGAVESPHSAPAKSAAVE